ESQAELERSPFYGPVFEGWIAAEIVKAQSNAGRRPELYYFRDRRGLEVDFVVPGKGATTLLVEAKATRTPTPAMAKPMLALSAVLRDRRPHRVDAVLVHR